ncbi:Tat pathway signal sequence domain protein [Streptomyces sp. NPDC060053]|uniref:Tat pathway signal sequence domain protein n=1 Tax=Streptomyces sp. NPDC060053 TaxID=3347047 RepID=UPI0036BBB3EB
MSGVGPVEPGEGTHAWDTHDDGRTADADRTTDAGRTARADRTPGHTDALDADAPTPAARLLRGLARLPTAHRRATSAALAAVALLAGGGYLYATRPHEPEQAAPAPPFPSQVVDVTYLGQVAVPPGTRPRTFAFEVLLGVDSGPPVTVTRVTQPYAGLSLTSAPRAPFRTKAGSVRKVVITMHATECGKVPRDAGLPFIDVTLRNARAIQAHSYILGTRYAQDLSEALQVACSNESGHHQNA